MLSGITPRTMCMPNYSKNEVILVRYPFSALSGVKVRPAIIVNAPHVSQQGYSVFGKGLQIKPKTSERVLFHVGLCLTGTPPMTQNPFIKIDFYDSTTPSPHRGLLRHRGLSQVAWQTPSFIRHSRPVVLRHVVWLPELQCHRRMGTQLRHRYRASPRLHAQHALCLNAAHHLSMLRPRGV